MRPEVTLHNTVSADGRIQWVGTSLEALGTHYALAARLEAEAILMGTETALLLGGHESAAEAARPLPRPKTRPLPPGTEPLVREPRPLLVVPDRRGRLRNWRLLQQEPWWQDVAALVCPSTPSEHREYLTRRQVPALEAGGESGDLPRALELLRESWGIRALRVDAGGVLNGALLRAGLVDRVSVHVAPRLQGGFPVPGLFQEPEGTDLPPLSLRLESSEVLEDGGIWLLYRITG